jgi:rubrerythrin
MRDRPTVTVQITDDDRDQAAEIVQALGFVSSETIARALAEARVAGYTAGVESCEGAADDAHESGYAEGIAAGLRPVLDELIDGQETHDCPACNPNPRVRRSTVGTLVGTLVDGRRCPLCGGYGAL